MLTQRKQDSSPHDVEQQVRKTVARQHTKDIQEYMKQIHSKDKELAELKRKLVKVCYTLYKSSHLYHPLDIHLLFLPIWKSSHFTHGGLPFSSSV